MAILLSFLPGLPENKLQENKVEAPPVAPIDRDIRVQIGERNDHGGIPDENRDALGHASLLAGHLLVLASGVGGARGGRVEGNLAVSAVLTHFRTMTSESILERLTSAMKRANEVLSIRSSRSSTMHGSGSSCAAVLVQEGSCYATRAGDVRVFVVRGTKAKELLPGSTYSHDDPASGCNDASKHGALGAGDSLQIITTTTPFEAMPDDRIVLVSPGICQKLNASGIGKIVGSCVPQVAAARLIDVARHNGAVGGLSAQVIQYGDEHTEHRDAESPPELYLPELRWVSVAPQPEPAPIGRDPNHKPGELHAFSGPHPVQRQEQQIPLPVDAEVLPDLPDETPTVSPAISSKISRLFRTMTVRPNPMNPRSNRQPALGQQPQFAIPLAIAMLLIGVTWIWKPWSEPTKDASAESEQLDVQGLVATSPPKAPTASTDMGETPTEPKKVTSKQLPTVSIDPSPSLAPNTTPNSDNGTSGFWQAVEGAIRNGEPMDEEAMGVWLQQEGDNATTLHERARARMAELRNVEAGLAYVLTPDNALTDSERALLSRYFQKPPFQAAAGLKRYIELQFDKRQGTIFDALSAYVQTHRNPDTARVLIELGSLKLGRRTRAWLRSKVPTLLAGP